LQIAKEPPEQQVAKVTKAANESHADCLRIITRAEIRMANEIDAAQVRGEVPRQGGDRKSADAIKAQNSGFENMGLDSRRVAEWRETRDAGEDAVEAAISDAIAEGRAPTKSDICAFAGSGRESAILRRPLRTIGRQRTAF
jgi:hypothetical protein